MKKSLGLKYEPYQFSNRQSAFNFSNSMIKSAAVMLGDNCKFWVVCLADAGRLFKNGYEYAR